MTEKFYTLVTDVGIAKITNGLINETKVDFTHMAVGDGGGSYYNPSSSQTALVNETWRGPVSIVNVDENSNNRLQIIAPIPSSIGGFFIREVGLYDVDGDLIVIAKHPETYKPIIDNGSTKDLLIKLLIDVANTASINLKIDPTIITATKKYVDDKAAIVSGNLTELDERLTQHLAHDASLTTKGHVQLSNATDSDDELKAATPKAVKQVYDLANSKQSILPVEQKRNIYISATPPLSPQEGDIWIEV